MISVEDVPAMTPGTRLWQDRQGPRLLVSPLSLAVSHTHNLKPREDLV